MYRIQSPRPVTDETIEAEIVRKGLTAPRVTSADIEAAIESEHYFTAAEGVVGAFSAADKAAGNSGVCPSDVSELKTPLNLLTFCVIVLRNGFTVTGESACASPKNFDAEIGRKIARENAKQKVWALEGYRLRQWLWERTPALQEPASL